MNCPFCERIDSGAYSDATGQAVAFPDAFPVVEGHTLVVPRRHVESVFDLEPDEYSDLWQLVRAVRAGLGGDGCTIGVNDGTAAGQTVPHCHVHVIPRRRGDAPDPRGGVRRLFPGRAEYWKD